VSDTLLHDYILLHGAVLNWLPLITATAGMYLVNGYFIVKVRACLCPITETGEAAM